MNRPIWRFVFCALIGNLCVTALAQTPPTSQPVDLRTVAEKSDYRATARYAEVAALIDALDQTLPFTTRIEIGKSGEGRIIPALVISDPPEAAPDEIRKQRDTSGKLVVFVIGNIHAGEVDGKEALPMIAREIAGGSRAALLKDLILIIAPIYNCDGNERVSKDNRPGQNGPAEGMGRRENAANLDLNRDFIKIDAPETRGLIDAFNRWDPDIFIDTHTTNGSYHRYLLTWECPKTPAGDMRLIEFARDEMMPAVARIALERYQVPTFVYGDFDNEHTHWVTYPSQGRYSTNYFGLRGRISVLSESYSYATYRQRIEATRDFVYSVMDYAAANRERIRTELRGVDERAKRGVQGGSPIELAIQTDAQAAPAKVKAAGFIEEEKDGKTVSTGKPQDYEVTLMTHFQPMRTVTLPWEYAIPKKLTKVIAKLRQHGIEFDESPPRCQCDVEAYIVEAIAPPGPEYQGHRATRVTVSTRSNQRAFDDSYVFVPTAQRLGRLAAYLLEPECEDGLTLWNFLDDSMTEGEEFPVLRVMRGGN